MRAPEFWAGHDHMARLAIAALTPIGWAYGATVAYKAAHAKSYRSKAKVVCVGNLTAGGTGKTPVTIAIAQAPIARGQRTFLLTRGYGGRLCGPTIVHPQTHLASDAGDEALLLAAAAPTVVSRDRAAGARLAEQHGADLIVMDDGHQNFSLEKDLSLVVIDAEHGFGNGRMIPAGPLREDVSQGLQRADAIILVGDGEFRPPSRKPVFRARLVPGEIERFAGKRVVAFAGIGRPEKFYRTLAGVSTLLVGRHSFPDHHAYSAAEIAQLRKEARASDAMLVTTEKDFVRLLPAERRDIQFLPIRAEFDDPGALDALLSRIVSQRAEYIPA